MTVTKECGFAAPPRKDKVELEVERLVWWRKCFGKFKHGWCTSTIDFHEFMHQAARAVCSSQSSTPLVKSACSKSPTTIQAYTASTGPAKQGKPWPSLEAATREVTRRTLVDLKNVSTAVAYVVSHAHRAGAHINYRRVFFKKDTVFTTV